MDAATRKRVRPGRGYLRSVCKHGRLTARRRRIQHDQRFPIPIKGMIVQLLRSVARRAAFSPVGRRLVNPQLPASRVTLAVVYGDHRDPLGFHSVVDGIGKTTDQSTADIAVDDRREFGVDPDAFERCLNRGEEVLTQTSTLPLVPSVGYVDLGLDLRLEDKRTAHRDHPHVLRDGFPGRHVSGDSRPAPPADGRAWPSAHRSVRARNPHRQAGPGFSFH